MLNNLLYGIIAIFSLFLFYKTYQRQKIEKQEYQFLEKIEQFIQQIKHSYMINHRIEEAVYDGMCQSQGRMLIEAQKLYEMLSDGREEVRKNYMEQQKNLFLKLLASLLSIESQFGSEREQGAFLESIGILKQDLVLEIWKRKQIRALFAGLSFLILFPAFFLKMIEQWGVSNIPELETYYRGSYGILSIFLIVCIVGIAYWLTWELRTSMEQWEQEPIREHRFLSEMEQRGGVAWLLEIWEQKRYHSYQIYREQLKGAGETMTPEQFLIKKILWGIMFFLITILLCFALQSAKKMEALEGTEKLDRQVLSYAGIPFEKWQEGMKSVSKEYRGKELEIEQITEKLIAFYGRQNSTLLKMTIEQLIDNHNEYEQVRLPSFLWFSSLLFGLIGWRLPTVSLSYSVWKKGLYREYEFDYYETILLLLSRVPYIDGVEMMERMEEGSVLYQEVLGKSLLSVYAGEEEMLENLREEGKNTRLQQIAENFIVSDQIGMKEAFQDCLMNRKNQQEQRKQENETIVKKRATLAQAIAFLPLSFIIGIYLIVPVVMESMSQLSGFLNQMNY